MLNSRRKALIRMAFDVLDKDGSGTIELADLKGAYDCTAHPDFVSGLRTESEIMAEFLASFLAGSGSDGKGHAAVAITPAAFEVNAV